MASAADAARLFLGRSRRPSSYAAFLADGSIQSGHGFVRRCGPDGKERWRFDLGGWAGVVTLR
jgi:hypothetical protein